MQIQSKSNPVDTASKFNAEPIRQGNDSSGTSFNQVLSGQIKSRNDGSNTAVNTRTPARSVTTPNSTQKSASKSTSQATSATQNSDNSDSNKTTDSTTAQGTQQAPGSDLAAYVAGLAQPAPAQPVVTPVTAPVVATSAEPAATGTLPVAGSATSLAVLAQTTAPATPTVPVPVLGSGKDMQSTKFGDLIASANDKFGKLNAKDLKSAEVKDNATDFTTADSKFSGTGNDTDIDPLALKQLSAEAIQATNSSPVSNSNPTAPAQFSSMLGGVAPNSDSDKLTPKVGSADWSQAVGQKVVWMVAGGKQTAELTLNPPDLGPLRIVISVNNDQASTTFVTSHPDVKAALESALPKLQQMMGESGVQLSGFSVSTKSSDQSSQQFERQKNQQSDSGSSGSSAVNESSIVTTTTRINKNLGMVDTFA